MSKISWTELFPTKESFIFFITYVLLFSIQGVLVTSSQSENKKYDFNITAVVLLTELTKLIASVFLYCKDYPVSSLFHDVVQYRKVFALYLIPAFLYSLYNNLAFINLSKFDPTTYNILLQFRVVITATLFQMLFKKKLNKKQWFSLLLLTGGCMIKQINFNTGPVDDTQSSNTFDLHLSTDLFLLLLQMLFSCFAGVYNEHLLKNSGADVNIFIQNVFMYLDSILCNIFLLLLDIEKLEKALSMHSLAQIFNYKVLIIIANNATVGIITSFFLKTLNSILKVYASSLELVLTALFSYLFLSIPVYLNTVLSIFFIFVAVYLYSQNPVINLPKKPHKQESPEEELLMEEV